MSKILVGTNNRDKFREIADLLSVLGVKAVCPREFGITCTVEETGKSYEENAILKAVAFSRASGLRCIAEDSGLEVDALNGSPGLYSARWAGEEGNYAANNRKLLQEMEGIPPENRTARFICTIVLVEGERVLFTCSGTCEGKIAFSPRGDMGFGYDPIFEHPKYHQTFAELGEKKHEVSHRANALAEFRRKFLQLQ